MVSWGALYYGFTVVIGPMQHATGWSRSFLNAGVSLGMLTWGVCAYAAGRWIQRRGARGIMTVASAIGGGALVMMGSASHPVSYLAAWMALGGAMAGVLYEPAFAVITAHFGAQNRRGITIVTLFGGLASTAAIPLTQIAVERIGWRATLVGLGAVQAMVCSPLHFFAIPSSLSDLVRELVSKRENLHRKRSCPLDRLLKQRCALRKPAGVGFFPARSADLAACEMGRSFSRRILDLNTPRSSQVRQAASVSSCSRRTGGWAPGALRERLALGWNEWRRDVSDPRFVGLTIWFSAHAAAFSGLMFQLVPMLQRSALSSSAILQAIALIGPMQILGRVALETCGRSVSTIRAGGWATSGLAGSLLVLLAFPASFPVLAVFAVLYGTSNGVMTVLRGAAFAEVYGRARYAELSGTLALPVILAKAVSPLALAGLWSATDSARAVFGGALVLVALGGTGLRVAKAAMRPPVVGH